MRLFIAVNLDERVRRDAAAVGAELRRQIEQRGRSLAPGGASWVAAGSLHLTLRFLGEVDQATAEETKAVIATPFPQRAFDVRLGGVGAFPPVGRPRVLWVGVTEGAADLAALHVEVAARLRPLPLVAEDRPFRAHLTLARFREPAAAALRALLAEVPHTPVGTCRVTDVVLYQSHLSPKGATYTALARGPLAPSVQPGDRAGGR
jgi:2'-5' RNA ligase